jgi:hypothetical protein
MLAVERRDAVPHVLAAGEAIDQLELPCRLEQPMVLVLAVDFDEMVAEPLEQRDRDGRVVDERAVASRARELAPHEDLAVLRPQTGFFEHRRRR